MNAIFGVIFHFIGGFASGSFYIPYKKVKGWAWESYWLVGGLFSWLIVPPVAAWLTIPDFWAIIRQADNATIGFAFLFGLLWGIGGLTYGLGVRYLGVSLGSSIILGLCMVFGALIPAVYYQINPSEGKDTISMLLTTNWGLIVMLGLAVYLGFRGIDLVTLVGPEEKNVARISVIDAALYGDPGRTLFEIEQFIVENIPRAEVRMGF